MIRKLVSCISIVAGVMGLSGCVKEMSNDKIGGELDFSQMQEVTLGSISTTIDSSPQQGAESKANGTSTPMAVGKTFRLYAFPKGETDMGELITTRTYTIKDVAGQPELDANQEKLFLPVGEVDIFLVGPVRHDMNEGKIDANGNQLPPDEVDIATPDGVFPQYSVDLVSSKTALTIKMGANQFQAQPLIHRMAQMEVVVNRPNGATYTDLNVTAISVMNQTLTGVFEFNATGGEITPTDEGTVTLSPIVRTIRPGEEFRATMYVLPRKQTQLRIGVFLTCKLPGATTVVDRRMESGIMTESLVAGQMNRFITQPYLSDKLIFRLRLMPWDDVSSEDIDVPALDNVLFSYSGLDAPRLIDGKMCVPDRSGNSRHGELVGDIRYNAEEKYYYAAAKGAYIKVPELGSVPVYTFEITAASERGAQTVPAYFIGGTADRTLSVCLPWSNNDIYFDAGDTETNSNRLQHSYNQNDLMLMRNMAVYAFTRNASHQLTIHRNGVVLDTKTGKAHNGFMTDNKLLWWDPAVSNNLQGEMKMYAARMTAKIDADAIKNNYRNDIANFVGITVDKDYAKRDYIEEGLILDLRGTNGYSFLGSLFIWPDASRAKNHAVVMSSSAPTYSNNCYTFNGSQYMQLLNTLGTLQNLTVEVVAKASASSTTLLNFASNPQGGDSFREFSLNLASSRYLYCHSPFATFGRKRLEIQKYLSDMSYDYDYQKLNPNQWSFARYNDKGESVLEARLNGHMEVSRSVSETQLLEMRYCFIGSNGPTSPQYFNTSIYAIRVYNRILTDLERQHNYQTDKLKYNLVP